MYKVCMYICRHVDVYSPGLISPYTHAGTSFANPSEFAGEIKAGGPSAMELLAMNMKQVCESVYF